MSTHRTMSTTRTMATTRRRALAGAATGLAAATLVLAGAVAANAHVHVTPSTTEPGGTAELAFSFSHGCDGSPTTAIEVTIPDEVPSVALIANAGWQVASELRDGTRTVVFTAETPMPDGVRETLELEATLPEASDGTVLAFPALQVCEQGQTLWGDADAASDTPAPTITIGQATDAHGHGAETGSADEGTHDPQAGHAPSAEAQASEAQAADGSAAMPLAIAALAVAIGAAALAAVAVFRRRATD